MSRPATERLKVNPAQGQKPALRWLRLEEMLVDPSYQRSIEVGSSLTLIRRIAQFWDWSLCQPLTVAKRQNGALMIVDGQHRHAAAKMRGDIETLPCVVASYPSAGDEAAAFVALNQQRRPLIALDLFKASLASGDEEATGILEQIRNAGLSLAPHMTAAGWRAGMIGNVGGLQRSARVYGYSSLGVALRVFAKSFDGEVLRYAGTIFPGVMGVVGEKRRALVEDHLVRVLQSRSQSEWRSAIMRHRATSGEGATGGSRSVILAAYETTGASGTPFPAPAAPAAPCRSPIRPCMSFEEQLAAVEHGAPLVAVQNVRAPDPEQTLGGVGSSML